MAESSASGGRAVACPRARTVRAIRHGSSALNRAAAHDEDVTQGRCLLRPAGRNLWIMKLSGPGARASGRPWVSDAGLVTLLAVLSWLLGESTLSRAALRFGPDASAASQALWWGTAALALGALLFRRRAPWAVLAVTVAVVVLHMYGGFPPLAADLCAPVALYSLAATRPVLSARVALAGILAVAAGWSSYVAVESGLGGHALGSAGPGAFKAGAVSPAGALAQAHALTPTAWGGFPVLGLVCLASWLAGRNSANFGAFRASAKRRTADLERQRDQQAQLAVAAERTRLARELHDVVAHGLSVIAIQAQAADASLGEQPQRARQAVHAILGISRDSLAEMRRMLDVLRHPDDPDYAPLPGLRQLPALLGQVEQAGRPVEFRLTGEPRPLPSSVELSVYRIVQEGLTNSLKHGGPAARASVLLSYQDVRIELDICDVGDDVGGLAHRSDRMGGHGLAGMRERVVLLGGELVAGTSPSGGFHLHAWLPTGPSS
jgi:signal transduction histidine kinase